MEEMGSQHRISPRLEEKDNHSAASGGTDASSSLSPQENSPNTNSNSNPKHQQQQQQSYHSFTIDSNVPSASLKRGQPDYTHDQGNLDNDLISESTGGHSMELRNVHSIEQAKLLHQGIPQNPSGPNMINEHDIGNSNELVYHSNSNHSHESEDEEEEEDLMNNGSAEDSPDPSKPNSNSNSKNRPTPQKAASPVVIQWLQDNYEGQEGTSLPRNTVYNHYMEFCSSMNLEPVNAASFGKLIRAIFPNLKTRRLGTRGHSKYHYYGIRIKASSDLRLPASFSSENTLPNRAKNRSANRAKAEPYETSAKPPPQQPTSTSYQTSPYLATSASVITTPHSIQLPEFLIPETLSLPPDVTLDDVSSFFAIYRQHCQTLVDIVHKQHFSEVEKALRIFWQGLHSHYRVAIGCPDVIEAIIEKDHLTYKTFAAVLLPNVLQALPVSIPASIRQFSNQLEGWLAIALDGLPTNFCVTKLLVARKFSQSLHKQASLNHLTQAARAVLQNPTQINQMLADWNRLDFEFIKDQASWICQCGDDLIQSAQKDFKRFLTERASLEQWASWLQDIVNKVVGKWCNDPRELLVVTQQLLLKWCFYSTLIIRDLTIRNASSFDSKFAFFVPQPHLTGHNHSYPNPNSNTTLYDHNSSNNNISGIDSYSPSANGTNSVNPGSDNLPFGLETLLNKDAGRGNKLPFPFSTESIDPNKTTSQQQDDDYSSLSMLQNPEAYPVQLMNNHNSQYSNSNMVTRYGNNPYLMPKQVDEIRNMSSGSPSQHPQRPSGQNNMDPIHSNPMLRSRTNALSSEAGSPHSSPKNTHPSQVLMNFNSLHHQQPQLYMDPNSRNHSSYMGGHSNVPSGPHNNNSNSPSFENALSHNGNQHHNQFRDMGSTNIGENPQKKIRVVQEDG